MVEDRGGSAPCRSFRLGASCSQALLQAVVTVIALLGIRLPVLNS